MKLSQKISDFHSEILVSIPWLNTAGTAERLAIVSTRIDSINAHGATYNTTYDKYIDPAQHLESVVLAMNNIYIILHKELEDLKKLLKANMDIELTPDDIINIHIHVDEHKRHKVPAPTYAPGNQVLRQTHLVNRIFTYNPIPPHQTETHLPPDIAKIGRKLAMIKPGNPDPVASDYNPMASIGSVEYNITSIPEDVGKEAWLITWYISPTGEEGPPSVPLRFIII